MVDSKREFQISFCQMVSPRLEAMGMTETLQAVNNLTDGFKKKTPIDEQQYIEMFRAFVEEMRKLFPHHVQAILRISQTLVELEKSEHKAPKETKINSEAIIIGSAFSNNFKILAEKYGSIDDWQLQIMLIGLGIIMAYESESQVIRNFIDMHALQSGFLNTEERKKITDSIIQDALALIDKPHGRADSDHIRNAFAHSHFDFVDPQSVRLWDRQWKTGKWIKTFDETLTKEILSSVLTELVIRIRVVEIMLMLNLVRAYA